MASCKVSNETLTKGRGGEGRGVKGRESGGGEGRRAERAACTEETRVYQLNDTRMHIRWVCYWPRVGVA